MLALMTSARLILMPAAAAFIAPNQQVHVAGIRHRRQLLSLRVHGERNRLVLSAFESLPGEQGSFACVCAFGREHTACLVLMACLLRPALARGCAS